MVNSKRPQTSYGGMRARKKSLHQKNLKEIPDKHSSGTHNINNINEDIFPMPSLGNLEDYNNDKEDGMNLFNFNKFNQ